MSAPLIRLSSRAISLPDPSVDTDIIFPARYLKLIDRDGMDDCLFRDRRIAPDGAIDPDHPFNRAELRGAHMLVAGPAFGCGSSREQAVWALVDWGIRVVIAPDFGDIFAGNAAKNGLLTIRLAPALCDALHHAAKAGAMFEVDLPERRLSVDGERIAPLELSDTAREALMQGWDEIDLILNREMDHVRGFETAHRAAQPWLFTDG
ncbi:MAG: 3-isopropylmalate/(R)-2-methylmalate dehydratase small subunit [Paracoccaceae bacterium]|jgi:3-isopropylmalate/(R)-2-methylmalate dehydratase small subunit